MLATIFYKCMNIAIIYFIYILRIFMLALCLMLLVTNYAQKDTIAILILCS